jgi:hypothetical protein
MEEDGQQWMGGSEKTHSAQPHPLFCSWNDVCYWKDVPQHGDGRAPNVVTALKSVAVSALVWMAENGLIQICMVWRRSKSHHREGRG